MLALSGTLTLPQLKSMPTLLGLSNPVIVQASPDWPNFIFERKCKPKSNDTMSTFEAIFEEEINQLASNPSLYPVTLMFLPLQYMSAALSYCHLKFGKPDGIINCTYSSFFSKQHPDVMKYILAQLKKPVPTIRLVFCTSAMGMGFDSPSVERVIHARAPRCLNDYFQEVSRAGRAGQPATATLHFNARDIAKNLPGMINSYLVALLRNMY